MWGADTNSTQLTNITTIQYFSQTPQLNPGESAHCQVTVDFPSTPTDNALIQVFATLDDSTEVWDVVPLLELFVSNGDDPSRISFSIRDVYKFRVGILRDGTTDTITSADMSHRTDGVSL